MNTLSLFRIPIALAAALSAGAAGLVVSRSMTAAVGAAFLGVFLLACGASALNQVQERGLDGAMERTRMRPLPSRTMGLRTAMFLSLLLLAGGACLLFLARPSSLLFGLFSIAWYNGVYTPLKRASAYAALLGSLVGTIPPVIGWTAAGGPIPDPRLFALSLLLLLWQAPHFWLLLLDREQDYRRAGLPVFTDILPPARLKRIALLWTAATAVVPLALPLFGIIRSAPGAWSLLALVLLITVQALRSRAGNNRASFLWINAFLAAVLVVVSLEALLPGAPQ